MKKALTSVTYAACLCALLGVVPMAQAQTGGAVAKLERLSQRLKLTPEQKEKMLPVLKEEVPKLEAIKSNPSLPRMQKMKELRTIHQETAPQMQKILSPAQYQELQAIRREEIEKAVEKRRG